MKTQQGNKIIADLGPVDNLKGIQLKEGQQIELQGKTARVGNRPVLFARQVSVENNSVQVQRPEQPKAARKKIDAGQPRQVSGQVIREKNVKISGTDRQNKVVMLKTEKGNQIIADLGPVNDLKNVAVRTGEQLQVKGNLARISDQLILVANQVGTDGNMTKINRPQQEFSTQGAKENAR